MTYFRLLLTLTKVVALVAFIHFYCKHSRPRKKERRAARNREDFKDLATIGEISYKAELYKNALRQFKRSLYYLNDLYQPNFKDAPPDLQENLTNTLWLIADCYCRLGDTNNSIQYREKSASLSLRIARAHKKKDPQKAQFYYSQTAEIYRQIADRFLYEKEEVQQAFIFYKKAIHYSRNDPNHEAQYKDREKETTLPQEIYERLAQYDQLKGTQLTKALKETGSLPPTKILQLH